MCNCISYNLPEDYQTEPERVLTPPPDIAVSLGRTSICVDACIADLIVDLWTAGFVTLSCCCGHNGRHPRHVVVWPDDAPTVARWLDGRGETMRVMSWKLVEEPATR